MDSIIRLDSKGRFVIPNQFRDALDIKEGDELLLTLNSKTNTMGISPLYGSQSEFIRMEIEFKDVSGSLAGIANKLGEMKVDLVMTESKSFQRSKMARWEILADISKCEISIDEIKRTLSKIDFITSITIESINVEKAAHRRILHH